MRRNRMETLSGLWKNKGKTGEYLSASLGKVKIYVFPNSFKQLGTNQPDYYLCVKGAEGLFSKILNRIFKRR